MDLGSDALRQQWTWVIVRKVFMLGLILRINLTGATWTDKKTSPEERNYEKRI
jgi:hypothetical protein